MGQNPVPFPTKVDQSGRCTKNHKNGTIGFDPQPTGCGNFQQAHGGTRLSLRLSIFASPSASPALLQDVLPVAISARNVGAIQDDLANRVAGGSFCHLWSKNDRPPCKGFLFEGVANLLTKGGKKRPLWPTGIDSNSEASFRNSGIGSPPRKGTHSSSHQSLPRKEAARLQDCEPN